MSENDPIIPGCPSIFPHELPGGFDGFESDGDDCDDFETTEESKRDEREFYEVEKADAKRKGEW